MGLGLCQKLKQSRWLVLVVSCWIQTLNASVYVYSSYSQIMKTSMRLDQKTLATVATSIGVGSSFGIVPGYLYNYVPHWVLILAGAAMQSIAFFMLWLTIAHKIHGQAWQLCVYHFFIGASQSCIQTATIVTSMRNFPSKGGVVGLLKGFQVLGTSILLQVFFLFCGSNQARLPWMLSWFIPSMILVMPAVRTPPDSAPFYKIQDNLFILSACLIALGAYLLLVNVLQIFLALSRLDRLFVCLIIFAFLLSLLTPIFREVSSKDEIETVEQPLLTSSAIKPTHNLIESNSIPVNLTVVEVLCCLDFWLLFVGLILGFGSTSSITTTIAQLANSLAYTQTTATICVSLHSVFSCWGRIGSGLLSDYCLEKYAIPKPVVLMLAMIMTSVGTGLAAVPVPGALLLITILGGLAEGAHWCLSVAVASELFGMQNLSIVFNILFMSNPVGTYLLCSRVVGYFYDLEAEPGSVLCYGGACFRRGYAVVSAASIVAAILIAIL